jgi:hypothetical protein
MADKDYKAFIVEGEVREPLIIDNIFRVFFAHGNFKIITLPAGQNIYMLWKKLKDDDFDTDIIEVLREEHKELEAILDGLSRDDFSEVYLFFDYDGHQNNLSDDDDRDVIAQMLTSFDNETENGKLYISYPMVEALRDFVTGECGNKENCFAYLTELGNYKKLSAIRATYPQFKAYDFEMWEAVIDVFAMRLSCLMNSEKTVTYKQYMETISPYEILKLENQEIQKNRVFILSAFPEFLLDYFGEKLWRRCVKHMMNHLESQKCNREGIK